jgi:beta-glucosidase
VQPLEYGVATASYQVEGAVDEDGRGRSIWDTLCDRPGAIRDGSSGAVACDQYHRLDEDLDLVRDLGVSAYRFSVAWPRVQPTGSGPANGPGLDYYDRLVDGLVARGLRPLPTLYHWDLPQPLEDAGGWTIRETPERFADYAALVHGRLGDRVADWTTLNEPWCSAFLGYAAGIHAPGRREPDAAYAAAHHLLLGHALAAEVIGGSGIVLNLTTIYADGADAAEAARFVDAVHNGIWLDPLLDGHYPQVLVDAVAPLADGRLVRDGDLARIRGSAAWLGVNFYTPSRVTSAAPAGRAVGQDASAYPYAPPHGYAPREPRTAMGWEVHPASLEELLVGLSRRAPDLPLRVTENGAAYDDERRAPDSRVDDPDRIAYYESHLAAVDRARAAGADVRTYVAWTLLDNFEWAEGYTKKFGLVEVEAGTLRRIPKASYRWFAKRVRRAGAATG